MQEPSIGMVVLLGIGIVFVGLICLVALLAIMNGIFSKIKVKDETVAAPAAPPAPVTDEKPDEQTVAAISAAVAEALGKGVEAIRITSIKKVN